MITNNKQTKNERAAVETVALIKLGLDVHAAKVAVSVQLDGQTPKPAQLVQRTALLGLVAALRRRYGAQARIVSCYEAGPLGYALHRELEGAGVTNLVVVPQRLDVDGRRQKTDRLDARALVERLDRYCSGNRRALGIVRVPTVQQEQDRAQVRQRQQLLRARRQFEARGRSLLLTQGRQVSGAWWRPKRWEKLAPELPATLRLQVEVWQKLALETQRALEQIQKQIEASAPKQLPKGVGALTWVSLSREAVDWSRFSNRRQVASYTGLCPGISQSGSRVHTGSINRHGNAAIRHALIELTWRLLKWQPQYPPLRALLEKQAGPRQRRKLVVAAARRLAIDLWRLATGRATAEKVGLQLAAAGAAA